MQFETHGRVLLFITVLSLGSVLANDDKLRQKKHFSLFSVVTFKNEECSSESGLTGGQIQGTCYTATECGDKGGTKSGNCASGFGVCCIFIYNTLTSATITENRTYIRNPLFPQVETGGAGTTTTYTITRMQSDICQVRLDFDTFVIAGPSNTIELGADSATAPTHCNDQWVTTLGSNAKVPIICGIFDGEHFYMDIGMDTADTAVIALTLAVTGTISTTDAMRMWSVKTSHIPCWATYRAPDGCLRYFMEPVGQLISPNFKKVPAGTSFAANQLLSGVDLLSQNIKSCFRRAKGNCCIKFQVCNQYGGIDLTAAKVDANGDGTAGIGSVVSEGYSFMWGILTAIPAGSAAGFSDVGLVDAGCTSDYVEIPDSTTGFKNYGMATTVNTRYCGTRFGFVPNLSALGSTLTHAAVYDCTEPWEATYRTDQMNDNGVVASAVASGITNVDQFMNRGLCLDFTQEAC